MRTLTQVTEYMLEKPLPDEEPPHQNHPNLASVDAKEFSQPHEVRPVLRHNSLHIRYTVKPQCKHVVRCPESQPLIEQPLCGGLQSRPSTSHLLIETSTYGVCLHRGLPVSVYTFDSPDEFSSGPKSL